MAPFGFMPGVCGTAQLQAKKRTCIHVLSFIDKKGSRWTTSTGCTARWLQIRILLPELEQYVSGLAPWRLAPKREENSSNSITEEGKETIGSRLTSKEAQPKGRGVAVIEVVVAVVVVINLKEEGPAIVLLPNWKRLRFSRPWQPWPQPSQQKKKVGALPLILPPAHRRRPPRRRPHHRRPYRLAAASWLQKRLLGRPAELSSTSNSSMPRPLRMPLLLQHHSTTGTSRGVRTASTATTPQGRHRRRQVAR